MNTTELREAALKWWNTTLSPQQKKSYFEGYSKYTPAKNESELTGREIQNIWAVVIHDPKHTRLYLQTLDEESLEMFIRGRLQYSATDVPKPHEERPGKTPHKRFDMSGYGENNACHIYNTNILNLFADCGIYDCIRYLYLDAYKGSMTLYYSFWDGKDAGKSEDFAGMGTVEIITWILQNFSINCTKEKRRM
jgi:hypothetical protein